MQTTNTGSTEASANSVEAGSVGPAPMKTPKGFRLKLQQMLAGAQAVIPDGANISTPGGSQSKVAIVKELTDALSGFQSIDTPLAALVAARKQLRDELPALHALYTELKDALTASFGRKNPLLAQFGLKPRQLPRPLTPEQRVARAVKARQTRSLRHTGGVRQKAAVQYVGRVNVSTQLQPMPDPSSAAAPPVEASPELPAPSVPKATASGSSG
jgi:hypothetical protein